MHSIGHILLKHSRSVPVNKRWKFIHSDIEQAQKDDVNVTKLAKSYRISARHAHRFVDRFIKYDDVLSEKDENEKLIHALRF